MTFTPGNYDTTQNVTVTATEDDDGEDSTVTIKGTASGGDYASFVLPDVSIDVEDNDPKGLEFRASDFNNAANQEIDIDEDGSTKSYNVRLKTQPTGNVLVTPSADFGRVAFVPAVTVLTFTTTNWNTYQPITFKARDDDNAHDPTETITHMISGYGTLDSSEQPGPVNVDIEDLDEVGVTIAANKNPDGFLEVVEESTTGSPFTVRLTSAPAGAGTGNSSQTRLTFTVPAGLTVNPNAFSFNSGNWDTPKVFTVTAAHDDDGVPTTFDLQPQFVMVGGNISSDYTGHAVDPVKIKVLDDDIPMLAISRSTVTVGETATLMNAYTVKPTTQPTGTFTVNLASSNTAKVTVSPPTLTFNAGDWQTPQDVHITGVDDDDAFVNMAMITHTAAMTGTDDDEYEGITGDPVTVTVTETDTRGVTFIDTTLDGSTHTISVNEDGSSEYKIRLTSAPYPESGVVTVTIIDPSETNPVSNMDITASPGSVTLDKDNWETGETVTVSMAEDADTTHDMDTISHTVMGADYGTNSVTAPDVRVDTVDNDSPSVNISKSSVNPTEGSTDTYQVKLNTQPTSTVTVTLSSNNTDVTLSDTSLTFNGTTWNTAGDGNGYG